MVAAGAGNEATMGGVNNSSNNSGNNPGRTRANDSIKAKTYLYNIETSFFVSE